MPSKKYILRYGEPAPLEISWSGGWFRLKENFRIRHNGQRIGEFPTRSELEKGQQFQLPDDSMLEIKLIGHRFTILLNGRMVQDMPNLKMVQSSMFMLAFCLFLFGLYTYTFRYSPSSSAYFYEYVGGSKSSPALYFNVVGLTAIGLTFLYLLAGYLTKRNILFGYLGLSFLVFVSLLIFWLIFPSFSGTTTIHANLVFLCSISLCIFAVDLRKFQLHRKKINKPGEQL